jgi:glycosyltransferase involved in cell wall biosynthesis
VSARKLLIVLSDPLSPLLEKGEVIPRYYNPGDLFDEVHFLLLNADRPDPARLQRQVGRANAAIHNMPMWPQFLIRSAGLATPLVRRWASPAIELARSLELSAVRSFSPWLDGFVASQIKRALGVPYLLSLHGNPDVDYFRGRLARTTYERLWGIALDHIETVAVCEADVVMPVYSPILPYFTRKPARRVELVYNTVGLGLRRKESYSLDPGHVRLICVGRQEPLQKDPTAIVAAVAGLAGVHLTLVGSGALHDRLKVQAQRLGALDRIHFEPAMPNNRLMAALADYDMFVYSSINFEISKGCMEAALCGLPVVLNDRNGEPARELVDAGFRLVPDTAAAYHTAISSLIADDAARATLGQRLRREAESRWDPRTTEARQAGLYRELVEGQKKEVAGHG